MGVTNGEKNPDAPPTKEASEEQIEVQPWKEYFRPATATKILNGRFYTFSAIIGVYYLLQFICCICTAAYYSDYERSNPCTVGEETALFDTPLLLLAIFHIFEWIRTTVLLTVVCVAVNLVHVWYFTIFNSLFGLIVYLYVHAVIFSPEGRACSAADRQPSRGTWLIVEVILFWITFFITAFPLMWFRCMKKETLE